MKTPDLIRTIEIKDRTGKVVGTKEVVTYPGLLSKAHEEGLSQIGTTLVQTPTEENGRTAIAKAVVETSKGHFEAFGDASPENVNSYIIPHLIRMAETRAKARALRDAVNIGIVSFEELDGEHMASNGSGDGSGATPSRTPARVVPMGRSRSAAGEKPVRESTPAVSRNPADVAVPVAAPSVSSNGDDPPMTEAQRRYLFRIMAGRGVPSESAHTFLKDLFGVPSLKEVTKEDASGVIDQLLKDPELGKTADASPQH